MSAYGDLCSFRNDNTKKKMKTNKGNNKKYKKKKLNKKKIREKASYTSSWREEK